jgi:hypothetical protein
VLFSVFAAMLLIACPLMQAQSAPQDPAKVFEAVKGSYYHPDALPGLECDVTIDWPAFLQQLKAPADGAKAFEGLKMRSHALRDQPATVDFDWNGSTSGGSDQIQDGVRKMIAGFYQMYWPIIAKAPLQKSSEITRLEPQSDGTLKVISGKEGASVTLDLNKEMTPAHYTLDFTGLKGEMAMHYEDSPHPEPGDLRRLVGMDVVEKIGESNLNVNVKLDYQSLAEYFVPQKVSFEIVGAFSVNLEFSACTLISGPKPDDAVKP